MNSRKKVGIVPALPRLPHTWLSCGCMAAPAGSLLLESLKDHISTTAQDHCKAIYLHVLTTNNTAITFYENRDFKQHHYLPYYYSIRGVLKDGFTYVLYINGGHPPWTILYPSRRGCRPMCSPARQRCGWIRRCSGEVIGWLHGQWAG